MSAPAPIAAASSVLEPDPEMHLLRRGTFGPTAESVADIRRRGGSAWLDSQLRPDRLDDLSVSSFLAGYNTLTFSESKLASLTSASARQRAYSQLVEATLVRQIWSTRQLFEIMVDFWSNHFNVLAGIPRLWTAKPLEDREVIREHAMGTFEDLLLADARSAAMLMYLNNDTSRLDQPNENYGRELLELHTVGSQAGYTESHVLNSAYVLTGRSCDERGRFVYRPDWHYLGPVRVMGWSSPNGSADNGLAVGDSYLRYLARHRDTAVRLSRKLAIRFVSDDPPQSLVNSLADVYLANGTAIVPWLRALFNSAEFANSIGQKTRRPLEDLVGSLRAMGIGLPRAGNKSAVADLALQSAYLNHRPFGHPAPPGYPDVASAWRSVSSTLGRWTMHRSFATRRPRGLNFPPLDRLLAGPPMPTHGDVVDRLTTALANQIFSPADRRALLSAVGMTDEEAFDQRKVDRSLTTLTVLVLDSPYLVLR